MLRKYLLQFLIIFGTFVISGMHIYSTQSKVQIEPGASIYVYQSYVAIIRMDSDSGISFIPEDKYLAPFEMEAKESAVLQESCATDLKDKNKGCQASNSLPDNSRLKHFKSYLLPSSLSGLIFTNSDLEEFRKSDPLFKPSDGLRKRISMSGVLFFNLLLWFKLLCFYLLIFYSRNLITGILFIASFSMISFSALIVDGILNRGAGLYAIDPIINGSPTFSKDMSVFDAIFKSLVSVSKPLLAPGSGNAIWGITPRSVVLFVAFAICVSIFSTGRFYMLVLVPIGLGIHFTTFLVVLFFILIACALSGIKLSKYDIKPLILASIPSILIFVLQLSHIPGSYRLSMIIFGLLFFMYGYLALFGKISLRKLAIEMPVNNAHILVVIYYLLSISIILFYASRYEVSDTTGFWSDGFLREVSGRIAPLVSALLVYHFLSFIVSRLWIDSCLTVVSELNSRNYSVVQNRNLAFAFGLSGLFLVAIWNFLEHSLM